MKKGDILIVEDDEKIAEVLKEYLEVEQFHVLILNDGGSVVNYVRDTVPDLILLDILLPDKNGMEICRDIRRFSNVPIIFITARGEAFDRMLGLELGADDYICKPFLTREVVARVKAVLRRVSPTQMESKLVLDSLVIDLKSHQVTIDGKDVELTPIEYNLLKIMMADPGQVFTRSELITMAQGYDHDCYDRTIDNHIKNLRKKINRYLQDKEIIRTVFGVGYRINVCSKDRTFSLSTQ